MNNHVWYNENSIQNGVYEIYKCKKCNLIFLISKYEYEKNPNKNVLKDPYNKCNVIYEQNHYAN